MEPVLQGLLLENNPWQPDWRNRFIIIEGTHDYRPGLVLVSRIDTSHNSFGVLVDVVDVRHSTLQDVTIDEKECTNAGFKSRDHMLEAHLYGAITALDSPVTVLRWQSMRQPEWNYSVW